jgi:hypothetical protein
MMCQSAEEEPPGKMSRLTTGKESGETFLIHIGHKGRKVGVVGVFKQPNGSVDLKYELIHLGPEWERPLFKEKSPEKSNPVLALMEGYARRLQREDYLAKFPRSEHPVQGFAINNLKVEAKYVGSEVCGNCHDHAYKTWAKERPGLSHAKAYDTLVNKAKHPGLRQFDGECIVCHTVGFQHNTGYYDKNNTPKQNAKLHHVGCETCHGPGSLHANNPNNPNLNALMNPYKPSAQELNPQVPLAQRQALFKQRMLKIDTQCMKCHDQENDVHWIQHDFLEKWIGGGVYHATPPAEAKALGMKQVGERMEAQEYERMRNLRKGQ